MSVAGRSPLSPTCAWQSRVPWQPLRLGLSYGDGRFGGEESGHLEQFQQIDFPSEQADEVAGEISEHADAAAEASEHPS